MPWRVGGSKAKQPSPNELAQDERDTQASQRAREESIIVDRQTTLHGHGDTISTNTLTLRDGLCDSRAQRPLMGTDLYAWVDELAAALGLARSSARGKRPPPTVDVSVVEMDVGGPVPTDLLCFLARYGDCVLGYERSPVSCDVALEGRMVSIPIARILTLRVQGENAALAVREAANVTAGHLPIAEDDAGNLFCVDLAGAGADKPVVYFYREATSEVWRVQVIAFTFAAFLRSLRRTG